MISVAVVQLSMSRNFRKNLFMSERIVRNAAANGANVIVLPELFKSQYFCQVQNPIWFKYAETIEESKIVRRFARLAKELEVVIPISFFEKYKNLYYNSVAVADTDGSIVGVYRKHHIPQGPNYNEKYYFTPSSDDYEVFDTRVGKIGVLICFDQWFSEAARILALNGADLIVMPTAIGNEPDYPDGESYMHWSHAIQGHSAVNGIPIAVANRIGRERFGKTHIDFYGGSFITDNKGSVVAQVGGVVQPNGGVDPEPVQLKGHVKYRFDPEKNDVFRASWGLLRDRRPETYYKIVQMY